MFLARLNGRRPVRTTRHDFRRRALVEALEGRQLLATFSVTNVNDSGPGSLRQAILGSNAVSGSAVNVINFQIGSGVQTIAPQSALPSLTHAVTIDGTTQPGIGSAPRIVLDGTSAGAGSAGLTLRASKITIKGLAIDDFSQYAINASSSSDTIADNYLGLTPAGAVAGNTHNAINLTYVSGDVITGNVISGNMGNGIEIYDSSNNVVTGNFVGTNPAGTAALPNHGNAVKIEGGSRGNVIGGTAPGAGNVFSGNGDCGVLITDGSNDNRLEGNLIGTNVAGTAALGNAVAGVVVGDGSSGNVIGGTAAGAGNLISGNLGFGVEFDAGADSNTIQGNRIGVTAGGSAALGNVDSGIRIQNGSNSNLVGGTTPWAGNVVSANGNGGIVLYYGADSNTIQGNLVGTNAAGTAALGNAGSGVVAFDGSDGNIIGGSAPGAGNVISANRLRGVHIYDGSDGNTVAGNLIGTDVTGTVALGNGQYGILLEEGAAGNVIGGTAAGAGNTVANNVDAGIVFLDAGKGNVIEGDVISDNGYGQPAKGLGDGIYLDCSPGTMVSNNTIKFNRDWGVNLQNSGSSVVSGNTYLDNGLGDSHSA